MINRLVRIATGKDIILYDKHRNTTPLAKNLYNKQKFRFVDIGLIWKCIPFKSTDKRKHRVMYLVLSIVRPKYIFSMNWLTKRESLYKVWTAKHPGSKFIVVQHGAYAGGVVTDTPHKFTKCDIFLTWGPFFTREFTKSNFKKNVNIISFGNSVYNEFDRESFSYKKSITNKILLLPTALTYNNLPPFVALIKKLHELDFEVVLKEHGKQGIEKDKNGIIKYPPITGVRKLMGNLYSILQNNDFDFIIADHSTSLLDAIFFKNKVLYFDPSNNSGGYITNYSKFLYNLYLENIQTVDRNTFYSLIDEKRQEELFTNMVHIGDNKIKDEALSGF